MNSESQDAPTVESVQSKGRELARATQDHACEALGQVEESIRRNPWLYIGGALVVGAAVAALIPRSRPEPEKMEAVRDWLRDAYAGVSSRLPDRSDVQSAVGSLDLPGRIDCLRKKLHLD